MNEDARPETAPARRFAVGKLRASIGTACMVLAAAGIGYYIGSEPMPFSSAPADECVAVERAHERLADAASKAPTDPKAGGVAANVVLQNPSCFDATTRAEAQTAKDQIAEAAQWGAAERAGQCADPSNWGC
jgi:hypothetical protein